MRIRQATGADADGIAGLHAESWRATYRGMVPDAFLDSPIEEDHRRLWGSRLRGAAAHDAGDARYVAIAEDEDGSLAGFLCLVAQPAGVLLENLHVSPGRKGSGIGRALLGHAFWWTSTSQPGSDLFLWVLAGNAGAIGFYERMGATRRERRTRRFDAGFELEHVRFLWTAAEVGLVELALRPWGRPLVGVERHATPEWLVELQPSFPIPGPNHVCLVRCAPERVDALIDDVRRVFAARRLPCMWVLDPDVEPADLATRLTARGIVPSGGVDVMVLPASASVEPGSAAVEVVDALADEAAFWDAEAVQAAAFDDGGPFPGQHERYEEACADPARRFLLALVDGEPAGAGWATIREEGVLINGGAVAPRFQGRGVYRALVAARLRLAREVGAAGLAVQARPDTSVPILRWFGFRTVGRWRFHVDRSL